MPETSLKNLFGGDTIAPSMKTRTRRKRKSPAGITTNKLIFSAQQGTNDGIFPSILDLYVPRGSKIADVTYGRGVFWRNVPKHSYHVFGTDIKSGVDCRALPYDNSSIDCARQPSKL
jgi:hypothetical protein